ncbi:MAG: primosomal protein N' [Cytophagales bacterium]|nr:MAG: primosomal protein N' [Cytophagales bacterium]
MKIPMTYTYRIPESKKGKVVKGGRVVVQFGKKKILTAVVYHIHHQPPQKYEAKPILEILDETPLINNYQFQLIQFIAAYYLCTQGEVLNAALPSGFKLNSESRIQINPLFSFENELSEFSDIELNAIEILKKESSLTYEQLAFHVSVKNINPIVKTLLSKNVILLFEEIKEKYSPKIIKKVRLNHIYLNKEALYQLFQQLEKKTSYIAILQKYIQLVPILIDQIHNEKGVEKKKLIEETDANSSINTLIKKEIFEEFSQIIPRFELEEETAQHISLSDFQNKAIEEIEQLFISQNTVLLHGITGSGKTEVYIELIKKALGGQGQILFMVPEIALTTQLVMRLQKVFGKKLGVYHSKFSNNERIEVWDGINSGRLNIIVGVRSSIFLPFDNLNLIIIDEEHESSYKQTEPSPRYNARDMALVLAKYHHAKVLLGSATPSVETYFKATNNEWGLVEMKERFGGANLPEIKLIDLKYVRKNKLIVNDFSNQLIHGINNNIHQKKQSIIFQNRRGYSPMLICDDCGYTPMCEHCAVGLTYHMYKAELTCHYCGYKEKVITSCPACGSNKIRTKGTGTEKLEDDLKLIIPEARIQRMDLETTRNKNSFTKIIREIEQGKIDVLVGTQMVSKGFDFENVNLVGIVDFDRMLYFPDFRSSERTFQTTLQVSGRAGRRLEKGQVIIQTTNTNHWLLRCVINHDYKNFYLKEISEREKFNYPPFSRIIKITIKNTQEKRAHNTANHLYEPLVKALGTKRILGPQAPAINKIRNYYLIDIFIKIERKQLDLTKTKSFLLSKIQETASIKTNQTSIISIDVDPM